LPKLDKKRNHKT